MHKIHFWGVAWVGGLFVLGMIGDIYKVILKIQRARGRENERRQTDRQIDRQTDGRTDRRTDGRTETEAKQRQRGGEKKKAKKKECFLDIQIVFILPLFFLCTVI